MKILIIGAGNMGRTYAQSFISSHIIRPSDLMLMNRSVEKLETIKKELFIEKVYSVPGEFISEAELIIIAVKPQDFHTLCPVILPFLKPEHLVLSIMAGIKLQSISNALHIQKIMRAMPNLPSQIGMGMTAFTAKDALSKRELLAVENLLGTTGRVIYFENEQMIDAATAVSGSGPAYIFFLMNTMMKAAREIGFSESEAELLVWQTFNGSINLQNKSNLTCEEWIARVTSKGGTTQAAFNVFTESKIESHIIDGIKAAFKRAKELDTV